MRDFQADQPLQVIGHDDETVHSFVSRMAARNGASGLAEFCVDAGVNYLALNAHHEDAFRQILSAIRKPEATLVSVTPCLIERPFFRFGATRLHLRALARRRPKYCPVCFREDLEREGSLGPYQRFAWLLDAVSACRTHRCLLQELPTVKSVRLESDFIQRVHAALGQGGDFLDETTSASPTALEDYLVGRILGHRTNRFLDRLDPWVVAETSEALGATIYHESARKVHTLRAAERLEAGAAGFDLLRQGREVLVDAMDDIRRKQKNPSTTRTYFRNLLNWLEQRTPNVFEPIREIFRDYFVNTIPVRPGTSFLGKTVSEQTVFTLATAARHVDIDKTKFARYLADQGYAQVEATSRPPFRTGFVPAKVAQEIAFRRSQEVDLEEAAEMLGADRNLMARLAKSGLLKDSFGNQSNTYRFKRTEVEAFLDRLLTMNPSETARRDQILSVFSIAARFRLRVDEIILLLSKGSLKPSYLSDDRSSLRDIHIHPQDLRAVLKPPPSVGFEVADAATFLQTNPSAINRLCSVGYLTEGTYRIRHLDRERRQISARSLKEFRARFVSLKEAAQNANMLPGPYAIHLASLGVEPEEFPTKARFYRRDLLG